MEIVAGLGLLKVFAKLTTGHCAIKKCLEGTTAIVTGAGKGVGYETAANLASRGCKVIMTDNNISTEVKSQIAKETNSKNIVFKDLDFSNFKAIRAFAERIHEEEDRLDILINNAKYEGTANVRTDDGNLKIMQVNYLGHFLLTHLLLDMLKKTKNSRVIFVTSLSAFGSRMTHVKELNETPKVNNILLHNLIEYSNSQFCLTTAGFEFAERLKSTGVSCNIAYTGLISEPMFPETEHILKQNDTFTYGAQKVANALLYLYGKSPTEGSQTILQSALDSNMKTGGFFADCIEFLTPPLPANKEFSNNLWSESEKLVQLRSDEKIPCNMNIRM